MSQTVTSPIKAKMVSRNKGLDSMKEIFEDDMVEHACHWVFLLDYSWLHPFEKEYSANL